MRENDTRDGRPIRGAPSSNRRIVNQIGRWTRDSREINRISAERATPLPVASKTADIEGVLVTGVHGPAAVEIVLVR